MKANNALDFIGRPLAKSKMGSAAAGKPGAAAKSEAVLNYTGFVECRDGEFAKQMCVALAKSGYSLPEKKMGEAIREMEKVWPAMTEYGVAAFSTAYAKLYDGDDLETQPVEFGNHKHAFGMDVRTFVDLFGEPEVLVEKVMTAVNKVVKTWNETNGGSKRLGNRVEDQEPFKVRDIVQVSNKGEVKYSTLVIAANSWFANKERQNDPNAKIDAWDTHIALRHLKGVSNTAQRPSMSGIHLPLAAFVVLARSDEVKEAVARGRAFLKSLEPSDVDTLRWRFVVGADPIAEGKELKNLLVTSKKGREASSPQAKRQKTS